MNYLYTSLAFFVGFLLPVQVGINVELARFSRTKNECSPTAWGLFASGRILFDSKKLI